jgi:tetratricopeptide (TPR) repeat protein
MTPEDYEKEVPRKERSIEVEKFQGIYHTIWEHWYKGITQEQGYWDDQDLIAKVLELGCDRPDYTAIFCDEAQDFTRRELQLILRLSRFSRYHLGYQPIHSLPFAFAGDPFQTLNPTGFHWSSVRAAFDAEVIAALDPAEQLKLSINFQELAYNYRSSPPIVSFTNLIQLWRHVLFDIPELRPQRAWQQGNFPEPQKFILNHNIQAETLRNYIQDTIVIVPCEEGEELAYAQADEVLSQIFPHASESEPLKNVLSAISAKGLEFKRVILYKFGEDCNQNVWGMTGRSIDQKVKVEYFFNKLYVAASRATERLFVVDSEKGDRQLWQYASDEALLHAILRFARTGGGTNLLSWEDSVRTMSIGTARDIQELQEDDPQSIAREFESKGLDAENPELLRRATQFYRDIGETEKAQVCEAWALKFEMQFREAGARFEALGESEAAWQCFWQGTCWRELFAWYEQHPDRHLTMRPLVAFMVAEAEDLGAILGFTAYIDQTFDSVAEARAELTLEPSVLPQWKKAIAQYAQRLEALLSTANLQPAQWQQFGTVLQMLAAAGYTEHLPLAAQCFYRAEQYEQAIQLWEESGATQVPEYQQAKAALQGMPEGLAYLEQVGASDRIIAEWERAGKPRDRIWLRYVAPALEAMQQYPQAFVVYVWLDELAKVAECFAAAAQGAPPAKLFTVLFQYFIRKKYFGEAIGAIETYLPNVRSPEAQKVALKFDIVRELALSELTPEDVTGEERQRYERFIKDDILTADWQSHLLMQQVGVVLEKLGIFVETLAFYEQFVDRSDPKIRQFARERWLATKQKQVDYASQQGQVERAERNRTDLLKKARRWQIPYQEVPLTPPTPPKERPAPQPRRTVAPPPTQELVVRGLPPGTTVEQFEDGIRGFSVRHLSVRVMAEGKQVLITDVLSSRNVRVYWAQRQVNVGDVMVAAADSPQLAFTVLASGYSGVLICPEHQPPRLELNIQGEPHKIAIEL